MKKNIGRVTLSKAMKEILFSPAHIDGDCICFDMDGVLAEWGLGGIEPTLVPGYFLERPLVKRAMALLNSLYEDGETIVIVSAVYTKGTAAEDKVNFLINSELPDDVRVVFVPYGTDKKSDYVISSGKKLLIDDYSKNLKEWEAAGGIGVKYMNGVNGTNGTWKGAVLTEDMSVREMKSAVIDALKSA